MQSAALGVETLVVGGQVVWTRAAVSLPALVLLLQLRHLLHRLHLRLRNHRLYTQLANHMSQKYVPLRLHLILHAIIVTAVAPNVL